MSDRFVWNKKKPEWGPGVVLRHWRDGRPRTEVLFLEAGRVKLSDEHALLEDLDDGEVPADSPLRDAGRRKDLESRKAFQADFALMVNRFREVFPGGFDDPKFGSWERDYKLAAVEFARRELGGARLTALLEAGEHLRVFELAMKAAAETNLIHPRWERPKLAALGDGARQDVAAGLHDLLHGAGDYGGRLERFGTRLAEYGLGKWTIVSYFGFIADPDGRPFVKPQAVQFAANALHRDLHYDSRPNARTYAAVERLHVDVRSKLIEVGMAPRDMIDVQTFLWVGARMGYE